MSSNRNNAAADSVGRSRRSGHEVNQRKKVRSISRRLTLSCIRKKIGSSLAKDLLVLLAVFCTWLIVLEVTMTGKFDFRNNDYRFEYDAAMQQEKNFSLSDRLGAVRYVVTRHDTGEVVVSAYPFIYAGTILMAAAIIFIVQVILHWISYPAESSRIKRVLRPLDSIAEKADELSRYDLSEDKYHLIEDKIDKLAPDDEQLISLGDEDLLGIERAMNSLLIRIRENNKQQARFVNDASHELRTPIAVIQGYANMLARWGRQDEKVLDESITAIQNEADNMKHLVEQLLFLARGDAGRMQIDRKDINLGELMREVYEESLMIDENHIYKLSAPAEEVFVNADEGLIKQAVRILVDNAAKYTHEKDEIILGVYPDAGNTAVIRVQDSGIGMKENDVEHMFERFYRADEARNFNGTGLGLSIAKLIVDKHEGHFRIISREELGTRIEIILPRVAAQAAAIGTVSENIA
ncbi:MAG: HAMP domain-containing histidine kinase [Lachnospiraceae bacterium]|nr:HAMP domain-containing histidine kinase [Lachnospiraceae bacterium]